ncbi:phage tail sheath subtilisin-like domain-containing protein [Dyella sp. LX-66]|uniref:phage tail sheath family protein n=1 Tax=unclassified Dyella TaxID=2634549 RepID=UPI001BE0BAB6|nr:MULTISPECIES: phage tail sheath subtilisin-like domain-containing protein [unclassified Dyella]MBT2117118.1 phage tail sheath subtilisin-like domain-containing protein [Dyella sp. LX-1]MBT2139806.1 phage tail sheath subtilisin-like domain-containing protein [Dyella sp. LX-66]
MPATLSYPGVYIEEIPSGVRTITGVATSIAAFVGRAAKGPVDADADGPVTINSYGDYERIFGALDPAYPMGYAVRDFFLNGGAQAVIVRLYKAGAAGAKAQITAPGLTPPAVALLLEAASPGAWANKLRVRVDSHVSADVAALYGLTAADLFNLTVRDMASGAQESFLNVTVVESPRRVDRVLKASSVLLRLQAGATLGAKPPSAMSDTTDPGKTIWDDNGSTPAAATSVAVTTVAQDSEKLSADADYLGNQDAKTGIYALKKVDLFNLLCIPADVRGSDTSNGVYQAAMALCVDRRALLIVDAPGAWTTPSAINAGTVSGLGLTGTAARNAALFFPRVIQSDPARQGQLDTFVPCGIVAGIMARTDTQRGVWKAPAGLDASLNGVQGLSTVMTDAENGMLNPLGVNCLRNFPNAGPVVWGSRTLRGADLLADDYKYIPVRRLALYIEESLFRGTQWVVFEPNDEPLWAQIRLNVGAFMQNLFRQGAFQGKSPTDAYFVKCDGETTTQNDINLGIVNIVVGFAPLKPAEFVVIQLQQMAGQIQT